MPLLIVYTFGIVLLLIYHLKSVHYAKCNLHLIVIIEDFTNIQTHVFGQPLLFLFICFKNDLIKLNAEKKIHFMTHRDLSWFLQR